MPWRAALSCVFRLQRGTVFVMRGEGSSMKKRGVRGGSRVLLAALICLQLIYTTWIFAGKQVFHSDEFWSYGLANSYYQPFIYMRDGVYIGNCTQEDLINFDKWIPGEVFRRYVTVQRGERFAYGSVYHNQTLDSHPPLYYALLHTICSLFPDHFSVWYGFALNLVFLAGTQIFLYLLALKVMRNPWKALLCCLLYGVGNGALLTFTFVRQYSLLTMLCVIFTYFCACVYEDWQNGAPWRKHLAETAIIALCAFMTHYYAIIYVGAFTACFCLWLLCVGRWKRCLQFGFCMLGTLGLFLLLYPAFLMQAFSDSAKKAMWSVVIQYKMILNFSLEYNLGIYIEPWATPFFQMLWPCLLFGLFCLLLLYIPFRREAWMGRLLLWLRRTPARLVSRMKPESLRRGNFIACFSLIAILVHCMAVNLTCNIFLMGDHTMRYVFMEYPLLCFVAVALLDWILRGIFRGRRSGAVFPALALLTLLAAVSSKIQTTPLLIQRQPGEYRELSELLRNKNCLLLFGYQKDCWKLTNLCPYLRHAGGVFATFEDTLREYPRELYGDGSEVDYVLVYNKCLELDDTEQESIDAWYGEVQENGVELIEEESDEKKNRWLNQEIRSLNGGCEYEILFGLDLNGELYYVLELR